MALPSPRPTDLRPSLTEAARPRPITAEMLLPVLRTRSAVAMQALADRIFGGDAECLPAIGRIGPDLAIALAADRRPGATMIEAGHLRALGLAADAAFELAVGNLLRRSAPQFKALCPGVFASDWNDGFDSSRLLLPHLLAGLAVKGAPVVLAPTRGQLFVTGADDRDGLLAMADAAATALSATEQPLSAQALRLRAGAWTGFAPDPEEFAVFHDLLRGQWLRDYAEQKQLLDQLHAQDGERVLVADEVAMQDRRTGRPFCLTFWIDGAPSLLPRADAIAFKTAAEVIVVPWDAAMPIIGSRMTATAHYPARHRVETFPTAAELEQLRAVATLSKPVKNP